MSPEARQLYAVIRQIRTCFNRLKHVADHMHGDLGINASMRAVMEALATDGEQTVPDIARARSVSRQHIQVIMDALLGARLVENRDNPAHRRSPLFSLTGAGQEAFAEIRRREVAVLERLVQGVPVRALGAAQQFLDELNQRLADEQEKGSKDDSDDDE